MGAGASAPSEQQSQQAPPSQQPQQQPQPQPQPQQPMPAPQDQQKAKQPAKKDDRAKEKERKLKEAKFHVGPRYELIRPMGSGAYGLVWSAKDLEDPPKKDSGRGNVAIKKVANPFGHKTDAKRLMREIAVLLALEHPNVLGVRDLIAHEEDDSESLYIVTDLMDVDLHRIIQSPQVLSDRHLAYFAYQILRGLKYVHSAGILHRDLKPANLLLNEDCQLKICDFGLARPIPRKTAEEHKQEEQKSRFMTEYVVTRWYRAPEILMQEKYYTAAIDVWSVGCIMAEMFGRKPLFPGKDYIDQLICITQICGTPQARDIAVIGSEQAQQFLRSLEVRPKVPYEQLFPEASAKSVDLLEGVLKFNPNERLTVDQALSHAWLAHLHATNEEPTARKRFLFEYDTNVLTPAQCKEIVYREVSRFHPEVTARYEQIQKRNIEAGEALPAPMVERDGEDEPIMEQPATGVTK
eukprot:TRINITY_DN3802_c1_g3_i2.p1 TRINITY_DN3802_c1_g3~~TRINITY_DN3802_c1_g3_i2.p1  ORF type:complete len:487 (+),score=195.63 TRINITY_DN3802_c1_g3_i2:68-1462(+)